MARQRLYLTAMVAFACIVCTSSQAGDLLVDDFNAGSTPPDDGRVFESRLDTGWRATTGYGSPSYPSLWEITGGRMENPVNVAPTLPRQYTESESPVWQWWTNSASGVSNRRVRLTFDYNVGAGDSLHVHFWAVQTGGATVGANFITNNQGWIDGRSGQNQATTISGYVPYNLANGSNPPTNTASISGALTGAGSFKWDLYPGTLGIPGITTLGDIDTFFIAFAANETGGGSTWVDNLNISVAPASVFSFR